jgi:branched-subunit amino acid transport protein AzlD
MALVGEFWPYGLLVLVGFLPNEAWRWLGLILARGLDQDAEIIVWVRGVATAVLAGVIARIVLIPPGALASIPTPVSLAAIAVGFAGFLLIRRSVFAGVVAGEAVLIGGAMLYGP